MTRSLPLHPHDTHRVRRFDGSLIRINIATVSKPHNQIRKVTMSTTSPKTAEPTFDERFIARLEGLREDGAAMAALRRGLGKPPGTEAGMHPYILPWLGGIRDGWQENVFYVVASLFASWHQGKLGSFPNPPRNLGASLARLRDESDSIEKRFIALLNSHEDDVAQHLRHAVGLLRSKDVLIDWPQFLRDLRGWGWESRSVQRAWARGFWKTDSGSEQADDSGSSNTETPD